MTFKSIQFIHGPKLFFSSIVLEILRTQLKNISLNRNNKRIPTILENHWEIEKIISQFFGSKLKLSLVFNEIENNQEWMVNWRILKKWPKITCRKIERILFWESNFSKFVGGNSEITLRKIWNDFSSAKMMILIISNSTQSKVRM